MYNSDKQLHKADAFPFYRFEMILCSTYIVESLGGDKKNIWGFCMLYLLKCEVSSKLKLIHKKKKVLIVDLGWFYCIDAVWCHSNKSMRLHVFWNHNVSESNNGGLRRGFGNVSWISRFQCHIFLMKTLIYVLTTIGVSHVSISTDVHPIYLKFTL